MNITPIRTKDWEWSVGATYSKNWSKVKELWDGLDEYTIPVGTTSTGLYLLCVVYLTY